MIFIRLAAPLIGLCLYSCTQVDKKNYAEVEYYYYDYFDSTQTRNVEIEALVQDYLKRPKDYILTEKSAARGWPYYEEVNQGVKVEREVIMPPHSTLHRMKGLSELKDQNSEVKKLEITILWTNEEEISVRIRLYKGKPDDWKRVSNQPPYKFHVKDRSTNEIASDIAKASIRATFK